MEITPYHAKYFAYELTRQVSSDSLEKLTSSLLDAQVDLNPHQVEAALFAFKSPLSKGAILADEVGLGKTIEAGLVISQKWAERKRKILIIVPANLRKQWYQELSDKFFLSSVILETKSFNEEIKKDNLNPFNQRNIVICSYQFARQKENYIEKINWDLVVIDEAHRLRNVYKPSNKIANSIKSSTLKSPKILLTATPLQNSLLELFGLVSIIDDYSFGDLKSFKNQFSRLTDEENFEDLKNRLKPICKRTLRRQVLEYVKFTNRYAIVQEFYPSEDEQKLYDLVSEYLRKPSLYALPPSQRKLMTLILRKLLASSTFAIAGTLEALEKRLQDVVNNQEKEDLMENVSADFESAPELLDEWDNEDETEKTDFYTPEEIEGIKEEIILLNEFKNLAKSIIKNSKGEVLLTALKKGFEKIEEKNGNKKALIFTESTRTQKYLFEILENTVYKDKIVLFNGSNNDKKTKEIYEKWIEKHKGTDKFTGSKSADIRAAIVDFFRDEAVIMIATEAAAEGINLQFCSLVVNYDLPWNPQRIEQRIGRCHRYGQKYDVVVVNFLNKKNAADQRVYELLAEKFKLFDGIFGASDEVLGSIESGVDFERRIVEIYQNCRTMEEIQQSFDELQKELESRIDEQINITRKKLLENFDEEVHEKLKINLKQSEEYLSKYQSWLWEITRYYLKSSAVFNNDEHSFYLKSNPFPNEKIHPGPYRIGKNVDESNLYRIGHPLAHRIIQKCKNVFPEGNRVVFDYSGSGKIISILEPLTGKSGWLRIRQLSIKTFNNEDYIIFSGTDDEGKILEEDSCYRLFSLPAVIEGKEIISRETARLLENDFTGKKNLLIEKINMRNSSFFDMETDKLDKWGEDNRNSLKIALHDLDEKIKELKKLGRQALNLPDKLKLERERRQLEILREKAWKQYDEAIKEVDMKKDSLLDEIEKKMNRDIYMEELFTIRWKII